MRVRVFSLADHFHQGCQIKAIISTDTTLSQPLCASIDVVPALRLRTQPVSSRQRWHKPTPTRKCKDTASGRKGRGGEGPPGHNGQPVDWRCRINVNDPGLITLVNKLQDVFTTVGVRRGRRQWRVGTSAEADDTCARCKTPSTFLRSPSSDRNHPARVVCWRTSSGETCTCGTMPSSSRAHLFLNQDPPVDT